VFKEAVSVNIQGLRRSMPVLAIGLLCGLISGCGGSGDGALSNGNPGSNDLNTVVAFGDSITSGSSCPCSSYPTRLSGMIGKSVVNTGIGGSKATDNAGRAQAVIDSYHPAFMLILYGVNDVITGESQDGILAALGQMVSICKQNNVVPVLATYPDLIGDHAVFSPGTLSLNAGIRSLAGAEGIRCVDLETEFNADPTLYEDDGLHPNDAGTQIMAMAFADQF
jgi:lysophospholipase L1-like esterase